MKKKLLAVIFLLTFALLLGGTKAIKSETSSETKLKDTLVIAQKAEIKTLDPQKSTDSVSNKIIQLMFDTLITMDKDLNLLPGLAESWESVDPLNTVFHLKKNVKFHNGDIMTAEDVKFSLDRARSLPQCAYNFTPIKKVTIIDENTIKITTDTPFGSLLNQLSITNSSIINKKLVEASEDVFLTNPVGTGQFKFKSWDIGNRLTMERFDDYYGTISKLKEVVIKFITENNSRMIMLETGEADISLDMGVMDLKSIKDNNSLDYIEVEAPTSQFIGFDTKNELLKDKRVRQAIAYAIDNRAITQAIYGDSATPGTSVVPPAMTDFNPDAKKYDLNIAKAKELLTEAGYPNGFNIDLWVSDDSARIDACVIIQEQLREIGINTEIKVFQWATYIKMIENENEVKPIFYMSWNTANGDCDKTMYPLFHSSQIKGSMNVTAFVNKDLDDTLDKARITMDPKVRKELYGKAQEILQEELPHYTILYPKLNLGMRKNIHNLIMKNNGYLDLTNVYVTE